MKGCRLRSRRSCSRNSLADTPPARAFENRPRYRHLASLFLARRRMHAGDRERRSRRPTGKSWCRRTR